MKLKRFAIAALLALALCPAAFADTDWSGYGTGDWGGLHPFYIWQGTLHTDESPVRFGGYWGTSLYNWIRGNVDQYDSETGTYYVGYASAGGYGHWALANDTIGHWKGWYHPSSPDTAWGQWGIGESATNGGTWWGDLAGD
ncbi:hypothetical protein GX441_11710 [bacterium]|nr:hypothetical protein [bacterium]